MDQKKNWDSRSSEGEGGSTRDLENSRFLKKDFFDPFPNVFLIFSLNGFHLQGYTVQVIFEYNVLDSGR